MPDTRTGVKLDFTSGLEKLPPRPRTDPVATTLASVEAGREVGFTARPQPPRPDPPPPDQPRTELPRPARLDGRRLRSRGANTQLNLKVTEAEKETILEEASRLIQDPSSPIGNIGEFVVMAVNHYRRNRPS